jgi:serine/threonine protein kinase
LKPSNILVQPNGEVKLLDFGIAKQLDSQQMPEEQTRTALRLMTPAYAAPEQIRGEPVGIYTDVYALGVILYSLLAEKHPFDLGGKTPSEVVGIVIEQDPERPSLAAKRSGVGAGKASWADLDVLCLTAMQKSSQRRYRSAEAFHRDIDHYLAGEPLEAQRDTIGYRVGKFIRRNRRAVAATALTAAIAGLIVFYTGRLTAARDRFDEAEAAFRRMAEIYKSAYSGKHYLIGIALANLGSVYLARKDNARAEHLYRDALAMYAQTLPADHMNVAITRIKLGRALLRQDRWKDAEIETVAGYEVLSKQANPSVTWLQQARQDLIAIYDSQEEHGKAKQVLAEQAALTRKTSPSGGTK